MTADSGQWTPAAPEGAVREGEVLGVRIGERHVALYRLDGQVFATDGMCTHQRVLLCDGFLEDGAIECPLHQGRFDVRSGKALCAPLSVDLKVYPVRVDGGTVYVSLGAGASDP
jgi:naphthalene 1,2-dioxygenase system ferredoxin subunit